MSESARSRRRLRPWLIGLGVVVVGLPVAGYAALWALVRSDAARPRLEAAIEAATGRRLTLSGPVTLRPALVPTIALEGPVFANVPGGSRPEMLRARRIEAEVALIPLLSREVKIRRIALVEPDLLLEIDAQGRGNWQFNRARPDAPAPANPIPAEPSRPFGIAVDAVTIERGRITWRAPGQEEVVELPRLVLRASDKAILAEGQAIARGLTATINGGTGPLAALLADQPGEWPFRLGLSVPGMNAEANGALTLPFQPAGWRARLAATADSTARLAPLLPGTALPEARNLSLVAEADGARGLSSLHASVAEAQAAAGGRALALGPVQLDAGAPEAPITLTGTLRLGELPVTLNATGPTLAAARGEGALPLAVRLEAEGLAASAEGALAPGRQMAGTGWAVSLRAEDLRALGTRAGTPNLPPLHAASATFRLNLSAEGADVPDLAITAREVAGRGALAWRRADPLPRLNLRVSLSRLDLDAIRAAPAPAAAPATPAPAAPVPAPPAPASPAPAAPAPAARADTRVIPDQPIDLAAIRDVPFALDADGDVAVLRLHGADWRNVSLRAVLDGKALRVERFAAATPGGPVSGALTAEAGGAAPRLSLDLRSGEGGVDPAPLLAAFGIASPVTGKGALDISLRGEGAGTRALAGSLAGHLGLAMTGGRIEPRLLTGATQALRGIVPENAVGGAAEIRCLALRFDLEKGVAQSRALLVQTGVANIGGAGAANLGDETLAFRLRPVIRVGDVSLTTPLGITGRFGNPRFSVDPNAATAAAVGVLGGLAQRSRDGDTAAVGALVEGLLGGRNAAPPAADCAGQLALARGAAPAVGTPPAAPAEDHRERRPQMQDLLRGLLGR
ncbi:AsmA family protein [Pararoseomonas indoligenes]|uniref:AsmA family protein n=1 Tax=Roseomonas indoligenes TaxID=2820811 RepID=A0A940MWX9_9PROT|nr:AsmA family protein [Pararoseomonas indoligenes]MBP0492001.1 AsmA family protein [Pararoseomonas indoligenes]